ncbi:MAG: hypothetical protein QM564_10380 [Bergeyella sp.]
MIFNFGNQNYEILRKYIQEIDCVHCEEKTEHLLVIYCKVFVFGLFYPLKWWASDKKGYMKCRKCGRDNDVSEQNPEIPAKVLNYSSETKIPVRYKLPSYLLIGSLILTSTLILVGFFSAFVTILTPVGSKLQGKWQNDYQLYQIYIYKDRTYTAVGRDTIMFGSYKIEKGIVDFPFAGKDNKIPKNQAIPLVLHDLEDTTFRFEKQRKLKSFDDIYRAENNTWRKKPSAPQNNQQIRNKILQYLEFEKNKFQNGVDANLDFIENDPNSVIIFALNGIQVNLQSEEQWRYIFYNDDEWAKANEIMHKEFPKNILLDSEEKNLFKRNVNFLNAYIQRIKNSDLKYIEN